MRDADAPDRLTWLGSEKRPGVWTIGSLMIGLDGSAPVDANGRPYQVLIGYDEHNRAAMAAASVAAPTDTGTSQIVGFCSATNRYVATRPRP